VLRVFMAEIKPSVREVMEDMMVDTANLLAELASDDLAAGAGDASQSRFAQQVRRYASGPLMRDLGLFQAVAGLPRLRDRRQAACCSIRQAVGADYSQWRDVARTLRGEYGAAPPARWRATTPAA
jgi:two-component system sensor histidine kinase CreC